MGFKRSEADGLLVACHRRCCVCHRFCGFKMELHHIDQRSESEDDSIENAIPLCFECHAEVQLYNDNHPRGRKFHPDELRGHKKQWLAICNDQPALAFSTARASDGEVGPLQALVDEIEYNLAVAHCVREGADGCPFRDEQFLRAIHTGSISLLATELKSAIIDAYVAVGRANTLTVAAARKTAGGVAHSYSSGGHSSPSEAASEAEERLQGAHQRLLRFLGHGVI
jgi:hypothetical protein